MIFSAFRLTKRKISKWTTIRYQWTKNYEHVMNLSIYTHPSQFWYIWYFQYFIYFCSVVAYFISSSLLWYSTVSSGNVNYSFTPYNFSCWWVILVSLLCKTICKSLIYHAHRTQSTKAGSIFDPWSFRAADIAVFDTLPDTTDDTFRLVEF